MSSSKCQVDGCNRLVCARGYCSKHYQRWAKHGDPSKIKRKGDPPIELICSYCGNCFKRTAAQYRKNLKAGRKGFYCSKSCWWKHQKISIVDIFWDKANIQDSQTCWEWQGAKDKDGYGIISRGNGTNLKAHRIAYSLFEGPIPATMLVCHSCDNPSCVNPHHLWVGTHKDNQADMARKNRYGKRPCQPGSRNITAKLTEAEVQDIRQRMNDGERTSKLADEYGVSYGNIRAIYRRDIWKHVI